MNLVLLNLQSNQQIKLDNQSPFIIGRGNVHGCYDKRVSRNHGRITCTPDGKIHLVALHCNPCFFTRNGVPPVLQLNKNEEETLKEGDCLGLLPNAFWFQVTSNEEKKVKTEPKDFDSAEIVENNVEKTVNAKLSENDFQGSKTGILENVMPTSNPSSSNSHEVPTLNTEAVIKSETPSTGFGSPEFEKTKRLPIWMYEVDEPIESTESNKNPKHCLQNNKKTQNKKRKAPSSNPEVSEIKKEPNVNSISDTDKKDENEVIYVASTSKLARVQESEDSHHQASSTSNYQTQKESAEVTNHKEGYESGVNTEVETLPKRPICQYEEKCFRKNPQHKLDFSHPGDADFTPYEERPLCQYGTACYRRNEKHRVEFRHSLPCSSTCNTSSPSSSHTSLASPLPVKRRRKKVVKQSSDYEDDDEYDLEDPFINDASSDEYIPSDSDSEVEDLEDFDTSQESKR